MRLLRHTARRRDTAPRRLRLSALSLLVAVVTAGLAAGAAGADAPIEGIWSFNGGKVAIKEQAGGTFVGTVVSPTKFAQCTHPVGEEMWTQLIYQGDGSYWGLHQWFFETDECVPNPVLGPTAWRVLQRGGTRFLRVCFSAPNSSQPTIAADGSSAGVTFECADSARISALPDASTNNAAKYLALPDSSCLTHRRLRIRIRDPKNDPLSKVIVTLRSGSLKRQAKIRRHNGHTVATLNLSGLSKPSFAITIRLTTVLGHHLRAKRSYRLCGKKAPKHVRLR